MILRTGNLFRKPVSIATKRWATYALAGAATTLTGASSADAGIHYSGVLGKLFPPEKDVFRKFPLDQPGDSFAFSHRGLSGGGPAYFQISGIASASFRGYGGSNIYYLSQLRSGQNISAGNFISGYATFPHLGLMAVYNFLGQWTERGIGCAGFKFNNGAGTQYGWVRVKMGGSEKNNGFKVLDYAYADPGEPIRAGQISSDDQAPDQGALGWLALGAAGLLTWRKRRSRFAGSS
jgi:MYXO-CTERM domain-containing protein